MEPLSTPQPNNRKNGSGINGLGHGERGRPLVTASRGRGARRHRWVPAVPTIGPVPDRLYFRQLLSGRDFAVGDPFATQMVNFVYLIGDRDTGEAVVIDPAYAIDDLLAVVAADGMRLVGALASHHHPDHVGGSFMTQGVEGVRELLGAVSVPVHVHRDEADAVAKTTGVSSSHLVIHDSGDTVEVGSIPVQMLHTPGHTPGSQCFMIDRLLVSGATLFLEGCGRTDLPGSDPDAMYDSLQRLATLPDDTVVMPGHRYSTASVGTLGAIKEINYVYKPTSREQWLAAFGQ
jgi:glyoxylase-like metal-dependent hydrolase (beta-lactamase superfamily II)